MGRFWLDETKHGRYRGESVPRSEEEVAAGGGVRGLEEETPQPAGEVPAGLVFRTQGEIQGEGYFLWFLVGHKSFWGRQVVKEYVCVFFLRPNAVGPET